MPHSLSLFEVVWAGSGGLPPAMVLKQSRYTVTGGFAGTRVVVGKKASEHRAYRCLPDTVDPRGPVAGRTAPAIRRPLLDSRQPSHRGAPCGGSGSRSFSWSASRLRQ